MGSSEVTLTSAQLTELRKIVEEHDPPTVSIECTNLSGVVTFQYDTGTEITQVLVSADGATMVLF